MYDAEIAELEQKILDAGLLERIDRDADGETREWEDVECGGDDGGDLGAVREVCLCVSGWED